MTAGFDRIHVELAFGDGAVPTERMLAAQRREQEELRCHATNCGDFEHQAIDDMNARDLASAVNGLAAYLERIRAEAS